MNRRITLAIAAVATIVAGLTGATAATAATITPTPVHVAPAGSYYTCIGYAVNGQPVYISSTYRTDVAAVANCRGLTQLQAITHSQPPLRYVPGLVSRLP